MSGGPSVVVGTDVVSVDGINVILEITGVTNLADALVVSGDRNGAVELETLVRVAETPSPTGATVGLREVGVVPVKDASPVDGTDAVVVEDAVAVGSTVESIVLDAVVDSVFCVDNRRGPAVLEVVLVAGSCVVVAVLDVRPVAGTSDGLTVVVVVVLVAVLDVRPVTGSSDGLTVVVV